MLEQESKREVASEVISYPSNDLGSEERMATEVEEVVMDTNGVEFKNFHPDSGEQFLGRIPWGGEGLSEDGS